MNSLVYADIARPEASSIGSTAQQLSMSFGVATALSFSVFLGLDKNDGNNISNRPGQAAAAVDAVPGGTAVPVG